MSHRQWTEATEASRALGVDEKMLSCWQKLGYLKEGTHWKRKPTFSNLKSLKTNRNSNYEAIFHVAWCIEEMDYWKSHDAKIYDHSA